MACKQETREIQGKQVSVLQWTAVKALDMQVTMMNVLGESSKPFINGDWDMAHLTFVLTNCERVPFVAMVKDCCVGVRIDGEEITQGTFDFKLSGNLKLLYSIFAFVLEVNFKDFFAEGQVAQDVKSEK